MLFEMRNQRSSLESAITSIPPDLIVILIPPSKDVLISISIKIGYSHPSILSIFKALTRPVKLPLPIIPPDLCSPNPGKQRHTRRARDELTHLR
jgi:hypothetical protein